MLVSAPAIHVVSTNPHTNSTTKRLAAKDIKASWLYIPKIDINVPFSEDGLNTGAWWRKSANGNPKEGGNFVLAAHRFSLGATPTQTARKSPFYSIDKLQIGDTITIDYNHTRYTYTITKKLTVKPSDVYIEERTEKPQLTLYSCTLGGEYDGRDVIIAQPN